jgi:hypothetical protein
MMDGFDPEMKPVNVSPNAKLWPRWKCECGGTVLLDPKRWPTAVAVSGVLALVFTLWFDIQGEVLVELLFFSLATIGAGLCLGVNLPPYLCTSCGKRVRRPAGQAYLPE